jgi:cytidylate kinase
LCFLNLIEKEKNIYSNLICDDMIITITGMPGSGKSSIGKRLAEILGYKYYSMGDMRREMAKKRGMTLAEFNKLGEKEAFTDKDVDEFQRKLGKTNDNFVVNGRLSYHFIPHSIKLFFTVDEKIAAERIMQDRREGEQFKTLKEAIQGIHERIKSDEVRYQKYYGVNPFDLKGYDLVYDTGCSSIEACAEELAKFVRKKEKPASS